MEQNDIIKKLFESNYMLNDSMNDLISAYQTAMRMQDALCKNYDALAQKCVNLQIEITNLKLENQRLENILRGNHIEY